MIEFDCIILETLTKALIGFWSAVSMCSEHDQKLANPSPGALVLNFATQTCVSCHQVVMNMRGILSIKSYLTPKPNCLRRSSVACLLRPLIWREKKTVSIKMINLANFMIITLEGCPLPDQPVLSACFATAKRFKNQNNWKSTEVFVQTRKI